MPSEVRLRKYPYPYRALLSLSNDIDGLAFPDFLEIHRFLNTHEETSLGPGLDLDVGDSFWFFSCRPEINDAFTYFEGLSARRSAHSEAIRHLCELGILDTLHTWGNFSQRGGFTRSLAEKAVEEMTSWRRRPIIWSDHGDIHNLQNIGSGLGDLPHSADGVGKKQKTLEYHANLLHACGITFLWTAQDVTPVWGQDRRLYPAELGRHLPRESSSLRRLLSRFRHYVRGPVFDPLIRPKTLRDGSSFIGFVRHLKGWNATRAEDLAATLSEAALNRLEEVRGAGCILVHFGFGKRFHDWRPEPFTALRRLAERERSGRIGVFSVARFLTYLLVRDELEKNPFCRQHDGRTIRLRVPGSVPKCLSQQGPELFHGLTFYAPRANDARVEFDGRPLDIVRNPPDHTGHPSVSVVSRARPIFPYKELRGTSS